MSNFKQLINPHSHSEASLDGAASVKQIVKRNKELGATHVCCTEHGNLNSSLDLYMACKKEGIRPIIGIEFYLESPFKDELRRFYEHVMPLDTSDPTKLQDNIEKRNAKIDKRLKEAYVHLTVHFKTDKAYKYFCSLTPVMEERATVRYGEKKPIITLEELAGARGEITIGSGCLIGAVQKWLIPPKFGGKSRMDWNYWRPDLAEKMYTVLREIAGPDDFFVEVFPHKVDHDWQAPVKGEDGNITQQGKFIPTECGPHFLDGDLQLAANKFVISLAEKYGDKVIISLDSHFATPDQKTIQDAKLGNGQENWKFWNSYHVASSEEAAAVLRETLGVTDDKIAEWIENSYYFANKFNDFKMQTSKDRWVLEPVQDDYMARLKGAIERYGRMDWKDQGMIDRLAMELKILANNGTINLLSYFFTIEDMANYCKDNDILMNVRGSAGGSLLLYLLGVSAVNPLKHDLSFSRFLTEGRIKANTLPDVDMDISTGGRDRLLGYLTDKYGDRFCRISTDSMLKLKSSIKDAERAALGRVRPETEALCRTLPNEPQGANSHELVFGHTDSDGNTHQGMIETHEGLKRYGENNPEIWNTVGQMLGIQRQKSIHACGVCIADRPVQEYCPIIYVNGTRATGFSPKSVEAAGLVKYDLLGLNTLLDIQEALKSVKERTGTTIDPWSLPEDPKVFEYFCKGLTETVFQFDTSTVRPYLIAIKPKNIEDLAAITALCRPGCLDAPYSDGRTLAEVYVARANGEPIQYVHQDLEPILSGTYGIQIYQEQSINIFKQLANYSDEQAETVRRGIGKKDMKVLESCMGDLRKSCVARGWTDEQVTLLIDQIMASARYAFNKSHSISYAYVAYACMYLKTHYTLDWWKSVLSNADKSELTTKFWRFVKEFTKLPDINKSSDSFVIEGDKLIAPISIIAGVGEKAYAQIVGDRPYTDVKGFVRAHLRKRKKTEPRSSVNVGIARKLIAAGILDSLYPPDTDLINKLEAFEHAYSEVREEKLGEVPSTYVGMTSLGTYMLKKELIRIYSEDLRELVLGNRGAYKDRFGRWRLRMAQGDVPIMTGDEIESLKTRAKEAIGLEGSFGCVAYVVEEKAQMYANKTKQMTKLVVDVGGVFYEEVLWPKYQETHSQTGFKGYPVIMVYNGKIDRFSLSKVVRLLSKEQIGLYNVV